MKFSEIKFNLKKDIIFFAYFVAFIVIGVFDAFTVIFDLVQVILTRGNSALLANSFLALNIVMIVVNVLFLVLVILRPFIKFRK
jgi:hypothetical protein